MYSLFSYEFVLILLVLMDVPKSLEPIIPQIKYKNILKIEKANILFINDNFIDKFLMKI